MPIEAFMSYSHRDEDLRNELETHLAMLKRQDQIDTWHDRRIVSGDYVEGEILDAMRRAKLILFLVSPDFLASNYCQDVELTEAIKRHNNKEATVIPIILRPCDWKEVPLFKNLLGAPTDNRPITKWPDRDEAFLDVTIRIRKCIEKINSTPVKLEFEHPKLEAQDKQIAQSYSDTSVKPAIRSSNLAISKTFTDEDQDVFLHATYTYIFKFFEASLEELCLRNIKLSSRITEHGNSMFSSVIYMGGKKRVSCTIFIGGFAGDGISYCEGEKLQRDTFDEHFAVKDDTQKLFLKAAGYNFFSSFDDNAKFSPNGIAEALWAELIKPLQSHI